MLFRLFDRMIEKILRAVIGPPLDEVPWDYRRHGYHQGWGPPPVIKLKDGTRIDYEPGMKLPPDWESITVEPVPRPDTW
jgi:hypothetical protein